MQRCCLTCESSYFFLLAAPGASSAVSPLLMLAAAAKACLTSSATTTAASAVFPSTELLLWFCVPLLLSVVMAPVTLSLTAVTLASRFAAASLPVPIMFPAASETLLAPCWTVAAAFDSRLAGEGDRVAFGLLVGAWTGIVHFLQATLQLFVMKPGLLPHSPASAQSLQRFCSSTEQSQVTTNCAHFMLAVLRQTLHSLRLDDRAHVELHTQCMCTLAIYSRNVRPGVLTAHCIAYEGYAVISASMHATKVNTTVS